MMERVYPGMIVEDARGPIGTVDAIEDAGVNGLTRLIVQRNDGARQAFASGMYEVVGDVVRLTTLGAGGTVDPNRTQARSTTAPGFSTAYGTNAVAGTTELAPGEELNIPVIREEAVVRTREVERGGVRVHKTINEREEVIEQPTYNEQVDVERVAIGRVIEAAPAVREEGDTLIIPVVEEMLVVEKRLVLKEEVRITRRRFQETEQARVVLREEQVQIERLDERETGT